MVCIIGLATGTSLLFSRYEGKKKKKERPWRNVDRFVALNAWRVAMKPSVSNVNSWQITQSRATEI